MKLDIYTTDAHHPNHSPHESTSIMNGKPSTALAHNEYNNEGEGDDENYYHPSQDISSLMSQTRQPLPMMPDVSFV